MKINIDNLDGDPCVVDLADVSKVYAEDDVIYFGGAPYRLSTASDARIFKLEEVQRMLKQVGETLHVVEIYLS